MTCFFLCENDRNFYYKNIINSDLNHKYRVEEHD